MDQTKLIYMIVDEKSYSFYIEHKKEILAKVSSMMPDIDIELIPLFDERPLRLREDDLYYIATSKMPSIFATFGDDVSDNTKTELSRIKAYEEAQNDWLNRKHQHARINIPAAYACVFAYPIDKNKEFNAKKELQFEVKIARENDKDIYLLHLNDFIRENTVKNSGIRNDIQYPHEVNKVVEFPKPYKEDAV